MSDNTHASTAVFRRTTSRERANFGFSRTSFCGRQAALTARSWIKTVFDHKPSGGARRDRTDDLLLAKQALSQLSYGPDQTTDNGRQMTDKTSIRRLSSAIRRPSWWAWEDLNCRPHAYQARALTN